MNFLQLSQRMILECAISGSMLTTVNQTGEMQRVTTWINQAVIDIQGDRNMAAAGGDTAHHAQRHDAPAGRWIDDRLENLTDR